MNFTRLGLFVFFMAGFLVAAPNSTLLLEEEAQNFCPPESHCSISVRDINSGKEIYSHNSNINSTPASVQKILTAYLALKYLGASHQFENKLEYIGEIKKAVLQGDLRLAYEGDPAFGSRFFGKAYSPEYFFQKSFEKITELKINGIGGCLDVSVPEASNIPNPYALYEDAGNYYGAAAGGFIYRDNRFKVFLEGSSKENRPIKFIRTEPSFVNISDFKIYAKTSAPGSRDEAYLFPGKVNGIWEIRGSYPAGKKEFKIEGALPSPKYSFVKEWEAFLNNKGIKVSGKSCKTDNNTQGKIIYSQKSPALSEVVRHILVKSDNVYAEQLLHLAYNKKHPENSQKYSGEKLEALLEENKLPIQGSFLDACGLSPLNYVSGASFTESLIKVWKEGEKNNLAALFLGGNKNDVNAIKSFHSELQNKLWIKTGYMKTVSSAGGYLQNNGGKILCFYVAINNAKRPPDFRRRLGKLLLKIKEAN